MTFWIDEAALTTWRITQARLGAGGPRIYSDTAIRWAVGVTSVYRLSLRAAQGIVPSLMGLRPLELPVPNYSTICRRQRALRVLFSLSSGRRPRHRVSDATGLRVYGAGGWHVQQHRGGRGRIWRNLPLGVDEHMEEIVAVEMTASHGHDSLLLPSVWRPIPGSVCQVAGDGAYDPKACYEAIGQRGANATIPPRRYATRMKGSQAPPQLAIREANLRHIQQPGRYGWRVASGCTRQSLAEQAVFRVKTLFGQKLRARRVANQRVAGWITCLVLNRMVS